MGLQNFGFTEIMIILVIVLLLFGAKRIPEIAGSFGKGINEFKRNLSDAQKQITDPAPARSERVGQGNPMDTATEEAERPEPKRLIS
ncbi:MAG: twin-arginine translocase TatA/TatE family subunit [Gemmatimonadaceae bacterium]|nr:twin-arginine translocase TatA/TatE family subunit [Gemmatimonadaceae bacterium]